MSGVPQVLLVEDDLAMQRLVTKWASGAGYEISSVRNGRDAMTMIESCCPHIVITARDMPILDGLGLCRWIRSQHLPRYVYTIVCTSRCAVQDVMHCMEVGADDVLRKPLDRAELFLRLNAGLRVGELEQRLHQSAQLDSLTGLASQRRFFEALNAEFARSQRHSSPLSCVMLDIDQFHQINTAHGHLIGDVVIRTVAETLRESARESDLIGRYGGNEFCVLLPEMDEGQAVSWAERVRKSITRREMSVHERRIAHTVSIGAVQRLYDVGSPAELVELSRQALRLAKRSGRNRVVSYSAAAATNPSQVDAAVMRVDAPAEDTCRALLTPLPSGLTAGASVVEASRFLLEHALELTPVVDSQAALIGAATKADVMTAVMDESWRSRPVSDLVRRDCLDVDERTLAADVYELLAKVTAPAAIVTAEGKPVGVVSWADALRWYHDRVLADANPEQDGSPQPLDAEAGGPLASTA